MKYIKRIEINHFRSINKLVIDELSDVNVLSGLNDVGKSNVIKALNLFFNNRIDWRPNMDLDLERDTNSFHTFFSQNARKKKNIAVSLTFQRPKHQYKDTLPEAFWVRRQWDREYPSEPNTTWGEEGNSMSREDWPRGLTWFLKKSRFQYVPAIRGRDYLVHLLGQFSAEITESPDDELREASDNLIAVIQSRSTELRSILKGATGLEFKVELPQSMLALLRAAGLFTDNNIPINMRGDGIQGLTVPAILQYLSNQSRSNFHYWGFEEPENSLEYRKAAELADNMRDDYSQRAQIFLTTHSPAFLAMENSRTTIYRVSRTLEKYENKRTKHQEVVTSIVPVFVRGDFRKNLLSRELGILDLAKKYDTDSRKMQSLEVQISDLEHRVQQLTTSILIVEGKFDLQILKCAWNRLYGSQVDMPFRIIEVGGFTEVTELAKRWDTMNELRMCALYDHDKVGTSAIRKLKSNGFEESGDGSICKCTRGNVVAMTLPTPVIEGRLEHTENLNLVIEFYFPDHVLQEAHRLSGNKLFNDQKYVDRGDHRDTRQEFDTVTSSMQFRVLNDEGKRYLADNLKSLEDEDFVAFEDLFGVLLDHLAPNIQVNRESRIGAVEVQQDLLIR